MPPVWKKTGCSYYMDLYSPNINNISQKRLKWLNYLTCWRGANAIKISRARSWNGNVNYPLGGFLLFSHLVDLLVLPQSLLPILYFPLSFWYLLFCCPGHVSFGAWKRFEGSKIYNPNVYPIFGTNGEIKIWLSLLIKMIRDNGHWALSSEFSNT